MILVDANVFVIDLRYPRDRLAPTNRDFLDRLTADGRGVVTLYTLLEVAGILSFNLNERQLRELVVHFGRRYGVVVRPLPEAATPVASAPFSRVLERLARRSALGDALALEAAEAVALPGATFVTWDAGHFEGRTTLAVVTPDAWLAAH